MKNKLLEASGLTPVEKMQALNNGAYRNIGAMSDQKLRDNQRICINNNFSSALYQIESEMLKRGLISSRTSLQSATAVSSNRQSGNSSTNSNKKIEIQWNNLFNLTETVLNGLVYITQNNYNSEVLSKSCILLQNNSTKEAGTSLVFTYLIIAMALKDSKKATELRDLLINKCGYTPHDIQKAVEKVLFNKVFIDKLQKVINVTLQEDINLNSTTPYMLRNDGELLTCGDAHPYIKQWESASFEDNIKELSKNLERINWYIRNSKDKETISILFQLKELLLENNKHNLEKVFDEADKRTKQEFCKVRTSNFKYAYGGDNGEIYFRISSDNFNWFDLIWNVVFKFKKSLKFVTIMYDIIKRGKKLNYAVYKDKIFNKMSVDEFLTLDGNPIIESFITEDYFSRNELISKIKALGKYYKFEKYTDQQLYRIYEKELEKKQNKADKIDSPKEEKKKCDNCGTVLTDAGQCPKCDFNDENESLSEDIEKHETLNPLLWEDNKLKPEVREKLLQIADEFLEDLAENEIKINVEDLRIVGSNCSYNYTKDSDLDLHIIANTKTLECPDDLYSKLYSAYRSLFNKNIDIDFYGIPVEIYVEVEDSTLTSNGIYSVQNDSWIKEPVAEDIPDVDREALDKEVKIWEDRYNEIVAESTEVLSEDLLFNYTNDDVKKLDKMIDNESDPEKKKYLANCKQKAEFEIESSKHRSFESDIDLFEASK